MHACQQKNHIVLEYIHKSNAEAFFRASFCDCNCQTMNMHCAPVFLAIAPAARCLKLDLGGNARVKTDTHTHTHAWRVRTPRSSSIHSPFVPNRAQKPARIALWFVYNSYAL